MAPLLAGLLAFFQAFAVAAPSHGFAYFGDLKYAMDMPQFDYAYADTPKGGTVRMSIIGTFNNLHAYVEKGLVAVYLDPRLGTHLYEPLMRASEDELASYYGRLAESVGRPTSTVGWPTRCATTRTGTTASRLSWTMSCGRST